ncbi:hypothetical protein BCU94_14320 [Shewanella sp. 10N.286.52.C2]|uniref:DUF6279 family lipoprotein n=1 Tax=Shewanella sp. 10N.286.52.C2 TaxID=1880838 RepID=UPI000C82FA1D|nr:DUF6279 family lipoprotein [Shewanella sp. 10N.286.52.C2]PMG29269.1 hypothetical protein BCU94_14320 [Shewanella sp. 10N.286.52.C2]
MKKPLIPILLVIFLAGCSTKFSYFFLDWAIEWRVDEYVELDKSQQAQFDKLLDKFLLWHQQQELARYSEQLQQLSDNINKHTLTIEIWEQQVTAAKAHWFRVFEFLLPDLLPIITSLSDQQVKSIITQLKLDNDELDAKYAGKNQLELVADANKRTINRVDDWLGSTTAEQEVLIKAFNQQRLATLDMWLEYRLEWLRQFETALSQRDDTALLEQRMRLLMTQPDELKSAIYQQNADRNTRLFGQLMIEINHSLSSKQRRHLNKKIVTLIEDLQDLSDDVER